MSSDIFNYVSQASLLPIWCSPSLCLDTPHYVTADLFAFSSAIKPIVAPAAAAPPPPPPQQRASFSGRWVLVSLRSLGLPMPTETLMDHSTSAEYPDKMDYSDIVSGPSEDDEEEDESSDKGRYDPDYEDHEEDDSDVGDNVQTEKPVLHGGRPRPRLIFARRVYQKGVHSSPIIEAFLRALDFKRHTRICEWDEKQGKIVIDVLNIMGFIEDMDRFLPAHRQLLRCEKYLEGRLKSVAAWFTGFPTLRKMRQIYHDTRDRLHPCRLHVARPIRKYHTSRELAYAIMDMADRCGLQLCAAAPAST
jgi:hypothetical protein